MRITLKQLREFLVFELKYQRHQDILLSKNELRGCYKDLFKGYHHFIWDLYHKVKNLTQIV